MFDPQILAIAIPIIVALIELWRWRRTPKQQSADAADKVSAAWERLADETADQNERMIEFLEKRIVRLEGDKAELEELLRSARKANGNLRNGAK